MVCVLKKKLVQCAMYCSLFVCADMPLDVEAQTVVRYVDENNVTSYTDDVQKVIDGGYEYDEYDDNAEPNPDNVRLLMDDDGSLFISNNFIRDVVVTLQASNLSLISGDVPFDTPIEVKAKTEHYYLGKISYSLEHEVTISRTFTWANIFTGVEDVYYRLHPNELMIPFKGSFQITQAWNGKFTHNGPKSRHALDVSMPIGTPIIAVKDGIVIDMKMDSTQGGPSRKFRPFANYIRLEHDDGTMSIYVHLSGNTQRFQIGDRVSQGQIIALSGNTGYSTGPHLHFALQANKAEGVRSIPYKFKGIEPKSGMFLGEQ